LQSPTDPVEQLRHSSPRHSGNRSHPDRASSIGLAEYGQHDLTWACWPSWLIEFATHMNQQVALDASGHRWLTSSRVPNFHRKAIKLDECSNGISRCSLLGRNEGPVASDKGIEKSALSRVGIADDGDDRRDHHSLAKRLLSQAAEKILPQLFRQGIRLRD